jgi:multidrug resistance efflux pump
MGRLERLEVALGQEVVEGQIVASLDDRDLLLDLREARAEIVRLGLETERERTQLAREDLEIETDRLAELRRFGRDVEQSALEHLECLADQAEDRILLQGLELTLARTRALVAGDVSTQGRLDQDRTAFDALAKAIAGREPLLEKLQARRREAESRYEEYLGKIPADAGNREALLVPRRFAVQVQEIRVERVNLEISKHVLRAPGTGTVDRILHRPGEIAAAGESLIEIVAGRAAEVVTWLPEDRLAEVGPGTRVRIRRPTAARVLGESVVAFLGARLEPMPERLSPRSIPPRWGLPVHIALPASLAARPGEALEIELVCSDTP